MAKKRGKNKIKQWLEAEGKKQLRKQKRKNRGKQMTDTNPDNSGKKYIVDDYYKSWDQQTAFKVCNHYPKRVARIGDLTIFGATKSQVEFDSYQGKDLILNVSDVALTSMKDYTNLINGPAEFAALHNHIKPMRELHLKWPDGGIFPVGLNFWRDMYDILIANGWTKIIACCLGGHGRTGTAIGSLLVANSAYSAREVQNMIRAIYCPNAIETYSQEEYLEMLDQERFSDNNIENFRDLEIDWSPTLAEIQARVKAKQAEIDALKKDQPKIVIDLMADDSADTTKHHPDDCICENCNRLDVVFKPEEYSEDKAVVNQEIVKAMSPEVKTVNNPSEGWLQRMINHSAKNQC